MTSYTSSRIRTHNSGRRVISLKTSMSLLFVEINILSKRKDVAIAHQFLDTSRRHLRSNFCRKLAIRLFSSGGTYCKLLPGSTPRMRRLTREPDTVEAGASNPHLAIERVGPLGLEVCIHCIVSRKDFVEKEICAPLRDARSRGWQKSTSIISGRSFYEDR